MAHRSLEQGIPESASRKEVARNPEYFYTIGHMYPISKEDWNKLKEYSQEVENLTKNYGVIPTSE